jgi:hypothetical protein
MVETKTYALALGGTYERADVLEVTGTRLEALAAAEKLADGLSTFFEREMTVSLWLGIRVIAHITVEEPHTLARVEWVPKPEAKGKKEA